MSQTAEQSPDWQKILGWQPGSEKERKTCDTEKEQLKKKKRKVTATIFIDLNKEDNP